MSKPREPSSNRMLFCPRCFAERDARPIEYDDRFESHGHSLDVRIHAFSSVNAEHRDHPLRCDLFTA